MAGSKIVYIYGRSESDKSRLVRDLTTGVLSSIVHYTPHGENWTACDDKRIVIFGDMVDNRHFEGIPPCVEMVVIFGNVEPDYIPYHLDEILPINNDEEYEEAKEYFMFFATYCIHTI